MKFKMNNRTYEIKEVSQEDLRQEIGEIVKDYFKKDSVKSFVVKS